MSFAQFNQYPDERLDYTLDVKQWLGTDTISNAVATADSTITVASTFTPKTATVWVSGGIINTEYTIKTHLTTTAGKQKDHIFKIIVQDYPVAKTPVVV